jgi:N-acetylmuramic acid 6-phosphate etherase
MNLPLTEQPSRYTALDKYSIAELICAQNQEDAEAQRAVQRALNQVIALAEATYHQLAQGGRLIYLGAGTSGRLGVLDASECPPTFGVSSERVVGLIAGGTAALKGAVEGAEDDTAAAPAELQTLGLSSQDVVVGLSASGRTPYVLAGVEYANRLGAATGCVVCSSTSSIAAAVRFPVEVLTGPEFLTGSTRLKAGTAQKMVLNLLTTSVFTRLGHVVGSYMLDLRPINAKLIDRGTRIIMEYTGLDSTAARQAFLTLGSVRAVLAAHSDYSDPTT